ncbi:MAG: hypothetical protein RLZZ436_387 [Planctomycetota bacterium]|jgi:hypothetical protein
MNDESFDTSYWPQIAETGRGESTIPAESGILWESTSGNWGQSRLPERGKTVHNFAPLPNAEIHALVSMETQKITSFLIFETKSGAPGPTNTGKARRKFAAAATFLPFLLPQPTRPDVLKFASLFATVENWITYTDRVSTPAPPGRGCV